MIIFDDLFVGEYFTLPNSYGIYQKIDPELNEGWLDIEVIPNTGIKSRDLSWDSLVTPVSYEFVRQFDDYEYYGTDNEWSE